MTEENEDDIICEDCENFDCGIHDGGTGWTEEESDALPENHRQGE